MGRGHAEQPAAGPRRARRLIADRAEAATVLFEPISEPQALPDYQTFVDAHQFEHRGLTVVHDPEWELHNGYGQGYEQAVTRLLAPRELTRISFRGKIIADGREVGYVERHLRNRTFHDRVDGSAIAGSGQRQDADYRLVSYDARLRITDLSFRGRGFADAWNRHLDAAYQQLGVAVHEITAVEIGAFMSARPEFYFDPWRALDQGAGRELGADQRQPGRLGAWAAAQLWAEWKTRVEMLVWDGTITRQQMQAFRRQFATSSDLQSERWRRRFLKPADVAAWGRGEPFEDESTRTWLGKYFLIGPQRHVDDQRVPSLGWHGVKLLQESR